MPRRLALALPLACVLLPGPALAQRVLVLPVDGDAGGRLRAQVEAEVRRLGQPALLALDVYLEEAAVRGVPGGEAFTGAALAELGPSLRLAAALGGEVRGARWAAVIRGPDGQPLWRRTLPLSHGRLAPALAGRLARAVAAAAEAGARAAPPPRVVVLPVLPLAEAPAVPPPREVAPRPEATAPAPPLLRGWLAGTTTWRSQCLRPGVSSCGAYELVAPRPTGPTVTVSPGLPALGVALHGELFPLARHGRRWLAGLGLVGHLAVGASRLQVVEQSTQGAGPVVAASALDLEWALAVAYRVSFPLGHGEPPGTGFAGLRAGLRGRSVLVGAGASAVLPSSQRVAPTGLGFPELGLEATLPVSPWFAVELAGSLLLGPRPALAQVLPHGDPAAPGGGVASSGFALEGGFSGQAFGPLGWAVRVSIVRFVDRFSGSGRSWASGGVGEESFTTLTWGLTARW